MNEKRIKAAWEKYAAGVLPRGVGVVQLQETRRAFFAGAGALLNIVVGMLDHDAGTEPTEADLKKMDELAAELDAFLADLNRGAA